VNGSSANRPDSAAIVVLNAEIADLAMPERYAQASHHRAAADVGS
jgi:hypothetical protein